MSAYSNAARRHELECAKRPAQELMTMWLETAERMDIKVDDELHLEVLTIKIHRPKPPMGMTKLSRDDFTREWDDDFTRKWDLHWKVQDTGDSRVYSEYSLNGRWLIFRGHYGPFVLFDRGKRVTFFEGTPLTKRDGFNTAIEARAIAERTERAEKRAGL